MTIRDIGSETCEYEGCDNTAICRVTGRWTVVDFLYYDVCAEHQVAAVRSLRRMRIDGAPIAELTTDWWTPEQSSLF